MANTSSVTIAHPSAADAGTPWYSLDYVYKMESGEAVLPRPPIK